MHRRGMMRATVLLRRGSTRKERTVTQPLDGNTAVTTTRHEVKHKGGGFADRVKILIASGSGGDGASIMSHEHNNEFAGPGGGNGGRGGNVFLKTSVKLRDLSHIQSLGQHIAAADGHVGYSRISHGRGGADLMLELPIGTQVVDVDTNEVVYDLDEDGVEVLLLEGGQGGKGNASFANRCHHSPVESTRGLPGNTMLAQLELKSMSDCALVGFPNAGKSSLLSAVSSCKPRIAPFPFTTLHPWVGVIRDLYGNSCRLADLPGLIDGAFENRGLGHQFLRHVERAKALCFVVDMSAVDDASTNAVTGGYPWQALETLQQECEYYMPGLSSRGIMVLANKMDVARDCRGARLSDKLDELRRRTRLPVFPVSASLALQSGKPDDMSGLADALHFMCDHVFTMKSEEQAERRARQERAQRALEQSYRSKHRGSFLKASRAAVGTAVQKERESSSWSLVDQQLDDALLGGGGVDGGGDDADGYAHLPEIGDLTRRRDPSLRGQSWTLSRDGDRLPTETWRQ